MERTASAIPVLLFPHRLTPKSRFISRTLGLMCMRSVVCQSIVLRISIGRGLSSLESCRTIVPNQILIVTPPGLGLNKPDSPESSGEQGKVVPLQTDLNFEFPGQGWRPTAITLLLVGSQGLLTACVDRAKEDTRRASATPSGVLIERKESIKKVSDRRAGLHLAMSNDGA